MAIINTLREKMGRLLVVVVGLAIVGFVLTDLLGPQSSILGNNKREVGEIDGEPISQEQYAVLVDNLKRYYGVSTSNESTMQFLRDQAWQQMVRDIAFSKKLDQLGLEISTNERIDMVQGKNISPTIRNFFTQRIGTTDVNSIKGYLQSLDFDVNEQFIFANAEQQAIVNRRMDKFTNMINKTEYVTLEEAKRAYQSQLAFLDVDYVYVPFSTVSDDQIPAVSDAEIRDYLKANEEKYTVEETRSIEYVSFPVVPSAEDTASYEQQMADIKARFEAGDNDSIFALTTTEQGLGFSTYDPTAMPIAVQNELPNIEVGQIIGPDLSNGIYSIHKVTGIESTERAFAKLSMISFNKAGLSPADVAGVRTKARGVLRELRNGGDFAQLARENSQGAYANAGGNMGWVEKGESQVADFADAAFARTRAGLITRLIETDNNIYIIKVDEPRIKNRYKIAQVILEMTPSFETTNEVYLQAAEFAASAYGSEEFNEKAGESGYAVFSGNDIDKNAASVGRLTEARQVVSWLYGEAEFGDVKEFELDDEYVVAVYSLKTEAGVRDFNDVKSEIEGILKNERKAEFIKTKMTAQSGTASEVAAGYGEGAQVLNNSALKMADTFLQQAGDAPEAVGAAFALQNVGDWTDAYTADGNGVVMLQLKSKSEAAEIGDYTSYENQIIRDAVAKANSTLGESVIDKIEVTDERYKYY
jgi:peptidyl-prolyl cis-trans isomerase D